MTTVATVRLDRATLLLIEEELRHVLTLMSIENVRVDSLSDDAGRLTLSVETPQQSRLLIGPHGAHLEALEHIVRTLLRRRLAQSVVVTVDVNRYRVRELQKLIAQAEIAAVEAERTGRPAFLPSMSAAQRRAVHTALANRSSVRTESVGEEPNRRVVIHPWLNQSR